MLAHVKRRPKRAARKMRITQLTVDKARAQAKAFLTWDTKASNLALRTQPTGHKSWAVIYSRNGRPRWLTLGPAKAIPLETARIMAAEAMLKVAKGGDPGAEKKAERGAGTFSDLAAKYLEHAKKNNKSWPQADALVRRFALPRWGKLAASSVTRGDVKAMMAKIEAPVLANQTLAAVSAVFSWGVKEEIATSNPCKLVERNPVKSRERVLADSELPLFWKALDDIDPVRAGALRMILLTGQRPGEVSAMRAEHVIDGWWQMPGKPVGDLWPGTKNGESHRVWLPKPVQELLAANTNGSTGYIFRSARGGPVAKLDDAMREICKTLGVERATPHDLRRTHGTTVCKLKFGRPAMNRIQNHKEGGIADVYDVHDYADENKQIMEAVAARIMALVEGRAAADNVVTLQRPASGA
jgi:integrase